MTNGFPARHIPSREWRAFAFFSAWAFISAVLLADDKPNLRREVEELIQRLDASSLLERSHAERQLLDLGPETLPFLPAPDLMESVSAREAIRRIRPQLERRAARESAAPSQVSLNAQLTVREILEQIQRQTRNRVSLADPTDPISERRLTVKWEKALFWECLDELCRKCDVEWQFASDLAAIRIAPRRKNRPTPLAVQGTGPFRLSVTGAEVRDVVGNAKERVLRVSGHLSIEPRLRPLLLTMDAKNMNTVTDTDQLLSAWNPDAKYEFPVSSGGRDFPVQCDFLLPVGIDAKTVAVRARFDCIIAASTEPVVFDQKSLTPGTIRRRGGVTVRLRKASFHSEDPDAPAAEIGVTVSYDVGGPAFESHRSWIFHNAAYLESKAKVRTDFTDFEISQQADGAVAVDYRFRKLDAPAEQVVFVYEAPTLIISAPVAIDLDGIPIK